MNEYDHLLAWKIKWKKCFKAQSQKYKEIGKKKKREREGDLEDRFRTPNMTNISSKKRKKWGRSIN